MSDLVRKLRVAYNRVAEFPEYDTNGFMNLLLLRNLIPEAADELASLNRELNKLINDLERIKANETYYLNLTERYEAALRVITKIGSDKNGDWIGTNNLEEKASMDMWKIAKHGLGENVNTFRRNPDHVYVFDTEQARNTIYNVLREHQKIDGPANITREILFALFTKH